MPKGIPVATFAIGEAGAANAALTAIAIIATANDDYGRALSLKLEQFRSRQSEKVMMMKLPDA
jgi:5-(carboxyamino)imidazole ribonucleotide mutase